jgi:hypothetical protein
MMTHGYDYNQRFEDGDLSENKNLPLTPEWMLLLMQLKHTLPLFIQILLIPWR